MDKPVVEQWVEAEYAQGREGDAAARQLCRMLGISGHYPKLKAMLEEMLASGNRASFDRSCILRAIDLAAPEDAPRIRMESYKRTNPDERRGQSRIRPIPRAVR